MSLGLPKGAKNVEQDYPAVWSAYAKLGEACAQSGPLDEKTVRLVKLALAIGAGSEGAVHSHTRRALEAAIDGAALKQIAMLAIPTLGFPRAVAAMTWIEDLLDQG
jgi:alkylhydroperoxidase/carboxymuconolactone decarboxylase family protein YurZ